MKRYISLLTLLALGCADSLKPRLDSQGAPLTAAEHVADVVDSLPNWAQHIPKMDYTKLMDADDFVAYERAALKLQTFSDQDVKDGIALAVANAKQKGFVDEQLLRANLFVLHRVTYAVPPTYYRPAMAARSPYATTAAVELQNSGSTHYPIGWPVEFGTDGHLANIKFNQLANGWGPLTEAELDWFILKFGHRNLPSCSNLCGTAGSNGVCQCDTQCDTRGDCCADY